MKIFLFGMLLIVDVNLKKTAKLILEEKCELQADDIEQNKTVTFIKKVECIEDCKPFAASSILFVCLSVILTGIMIYFHCKSRNNSVFPY